MWGSGLFLKRKFRARVQRGIVGIVHSVIRILHPIVDIFTVFPGILEQLAVEFQECFLQQRFKLPQLCCIL